MEPSSSRARDSRRVCAADSVIVPREIDHVFSFLTERTNEARWRKGATSLLTGDYRITNYRAPTRFAFEAISSPGGPRGAFFLRDVDSRVTEVTFSVDVPARGLMRWGCALDRRLEAFVRAIQRLPEAMTDWDPPF